MRLRISLPSTLAVFSIFILQLQPLQAQTEVHFSDPNLEAAIRPVINVPSGPILDASLEPLITLNAGNRGISDLSGIEHCTNLTEANLFDNQISDIAPLAGLVGLERLYLYSNEIIDIEPLSGLLNLNRLFLNNNLVHDIKPLVMNQGIDSGDTIQLSNNPLNCLCVSFHLTILEDRGVEIGSDAIIPALTQCLFELSATWFDGTPELKTRELFELLEIAE